MKKRVKVMTVLLAAVCAAIGWCIRFYVLNNRYSDYYPRTEIYFPGDCVEYGGDYFYRSDEDRGGYRITVKSAEYMTYDEFAEMAGVESSTHPEYVYCVEAVIENTNKQDDETKGIEFVNTRLVTVNDSMQVDYELFYALYPKLSGQSGFSLKPESEMKFYLPFASFNSSDTKEKTAADDWYLLISMYPTKKMIKIN